jgi:DNA-binding transcriptional ArsR family regulator
MATPDIPAPDIPAIDDPRAMRALAHPVRLDLLEALSVHGPLTATEAAALVGESPANCSWHLRQLAKYGFIEEDPSARGRQRPWRKAHAGMSWSESSPDPRSAAAARALTEVFFDREFRLVKEAMSAPEQPGWADSTVAVQAIAWLTADELRTLDDELLVLLARHRDRVTDPSLRPADARPVRMLALATPDDRIHHEPGDHDA